MIAMGFLSKLSKKERAGLIAAGVIITAVFIDRLVIRPIGSKLHRMDQEIAQSEKEVKKEA